MRQVRGRWVWFASGLLGCGLAAPGWVSAQGTATAGDRGAGAPTATPDAAAGAGGQVGAGQERTRVGQGLEAIGREAAGVGREAVGIGQEAVGVGREAVDRVREGLGGTAGTMTADQANIMLISHALDMAIEGSGLRKEARRARTAVAGQGDNVSQSLEEHARSAFDASDRLFAQAQSVLKAADRTGPTSPATRGRIPIDGAPSEAAGRVRTEAAAPPRTGDLAQVSPGRASDTPAATPTARTTPERIDPARTNADPSVARASSDQAMGSGVTRFHTAASQYARTLRSLGGEQAGQAAAGSQDTAPANRTDGEAPMIGEGEQAAVCLVNHSVCEAMSAFKIRQMAYQHSGTNPAMSALLQHAREMDQESRQAIRQLAGSNPVGGGSAPASNRTGERAPADQASPNAADRTDAAVPAIRQLAMQAQELVLAIDALAAADTRPGGGEGARGASALERISPLGGEDSTIRGGANSRAGARRDVETLPAPATDEPAGAPRGGATPRTDEAPGNLPRAGEPSNDRPGTAGNASEVVAPPTP